MKYNIEYRPDGSFAVKQGPVILFELDPLQAFLHGAQLVAMAARVQAAVHGVAAPATAPAPAPPILSPVND